MKALCSYNSLLSVSSWFTLTILCACPGSARASVVENQPADLLLGRQFSDETGIADPAGVAVDGTTQKVFIADAERNRVLRFSSAAALKNGSAAEAVIGQTDLTGSSKGVELHKLDAPGQIHVDAFGTLWVCDTGNRRVLRFPNASAMPSGVAAFAYLGTGEEDAKAANIGYPSGVVSDANGNLYVADARNHRVLRFDGAHSKPSGAKADAALGHATLNYGGPTEFGCDSNKFDMPRGLAIEGIGTPANPTRLYVADSRNHRVLRFDSPQNMVSGADASALYGQLSFTNKELKPLSAARTFRPTGVAMDKSGRLYVACNGDLRVLRFDQAKTKSGALPANAVLGADTLAEAGTLDPEGNRFAPVAIAVDENTGLWVVDGPHKRVMRWSSPSTASNGQAATSVLGSADLNTTGANWFQPEHVAVDPVSGKVFVADTYNNRILRFGVGGTLGSKSVPEGVLGQSNFLGTAPGTQANRLDTPTSLAFDTTGRLWVADRSNNRVLRFENAATKANGANADGVLGHPDFTTKISGGTSGQTMAWPQGVGVGANGRLWVADTSNCRVIRFDNAAAKANGASANGVLGQLNLKNTGFGLDAYTFRYPTALAEDLLGNLFIADTNNNRVTGFKKAATLPDASKAEWVFGQSSFTESSYLGGLVIPGGIAVDAYGRLFVSSSGSHRVLWYDQAATGAKLRNSADGMLGGQPNEYFEGGVSELRFDEPAGIALDPNGSLYIADKSNQRVKRYLYSFPRLSPAGISHNKFSFDFNTLPGQVYEIWYSPDLKSWSKEGTVTGQQGKTSAAWTSVSSVSGNKRRFYRIQFP